MPSALSGVLGHIPASILQWCWRLAYQYLARLNREGDWTFMNYGFVDLDPDARPLALEPSDEKNRFCIQLYHRVAGAVPLKGLDVLEIGCGRGGGSSYLMRYLQPSSLIGIDLSERAVGLCRQHSQVPGLSFRCGNAESLPFPDHSFDAVVNVESSHCYASMERFLSEVRRVLRPRGHFLFADLRDVDQVALLGRQLQNSGLRIVRTETITAGVLAALERDSERKRILIEQNAPRLIRGWFRNFAALDGSKGMEAFLQGCKEYQVFLLRNDAGSGS
jgi:SAM-dependent methyltransferase